MMGAVRQESIDPFDFPASIIPPGMVYQWCTKELCGEPYPGFRKMLEAGWSPVPAHRHRHVFRNKVDENGDVAFGGQVLMSRMSEVSQEAQELSDDAAHRNAAVRSRLVNFENIVFRLSRDEMNEAATKGVSCRQYALQLLGRMQAGLDPDIIVQSDFVNRDYDSFPVALVFARRRVPRHRWLKWLFHMISKEA